jgi:hypothetical protein
MSESLDNHGPYSNQGPAPLPRELLDVQKISLVAGGVGLVLLLIGLFQPEAFFRSLLFAWHYWLCVSLGCLGFVMISHLTGGGWGVVARRVGESAFGFYNLIFLLVVFLVLTLGYRYLFPWAHMEDFDPAIAAHASDKGLETAYGVIQQRLLFYTPLKFTVRTLIYFLVWISLAGYLRSGSIQMDRGPDLALARRLRKVSALGMVLFFVTTTGYALDYISGRETNWYSSILGFITAIGIGIAGMSFMSLGVCYFADKKPLKDVLVPQHTNDLGNILLALTILWMYTTFAQFLIQWNGNIPDDITYYTHRGIGVIRNGWQWIALLLLLFHFFVPFFLLLQKPLKRNPWTFARIAILMLFMRAIHELWLYAPSGPHRDNPWIAHPATGHIYWQDAAAWVGIGGIWFYLFVKNLASQPLLARNVADQPEVLSHGTPAHA